MAAPLKVETLGGPTGSKGNTMRSALDKFRRKYLCGSTQVDVTGES